MATVDYEKLVTELVKPITAHPNEVVTKTLSESNTVIALQVLVHPDDLGRVIGKKGRVANAIRTIAYAAAIRQNKRLEIEIDSFES